jgi:hypothetical protein
MRTDPPQPDAWHEAGHALVAHLLGGRVRAVSLESEFDDFEGHAAIEWRTSSRRELAALSGRAALGGPLAELLFHGEAGLDDPAAIAAWTADWTEATRCARALAPAAPEPLLRAWIAEVRDLLAGPAAEEALARIADALDAHGSLDEDLFADCLA